MKQNQLVVITKTGKSVRSQGGFGDELIPPALAVVCLDLLFMLVLKRFPSPP